MTQTTTFKEAFVGYETTDFSNCVRYNFNRSVRKDLVKKYKPLIEEGVDMGLIIVSPNLITTTDGKTGYGIIDGQHRIEAYTQLKNEGKELKPMKVIFYKDCPTEDKDIQLLIQNLNKGASWNINDFIYSNKESNNDLKKLEEFCFNHSRLYTATKSGKNKGAKKANMRRGAAYVCGDRAYYREALRSNAFKVDKRRWEEAEQVYNEVEVLLKGMKMDSLTDNPQLETIILAWHLIRNDYTLRTMLEALPKGVEDLTDFMDEDFDTRNTTKLLIWKARLSSLITRAYAALV